MPSATRLSRSFQFTRPRGARRVKSVKTPVGKGFNSRAHGGRDVRVEAAVVDREVSIHAPTGGATITKSLT